MARRQLKKGMAKLSIHHTSSECMIIIYECSRQVVLWIVEANEKMTTDERRQQCFLMILLDFLCWECLFCWPHSSSLDLLGLFFSLLCPNAFICNQHAHINKGSSIEIDKKCESRVVVMRKRKQLANRLIKWDMGPPTSVAREYKTKNNILYYFIRMPSNNAPECEQILQKVYGRAHTSND